uniref:Leukemia inhibitory factor receptor-like n=1 Tax=Labrus bergylta TaxID=56723 RepID=A0A3Q3GFD1_9LABR
LSLRILITLTLCCIIAFIEVHCAPVWQRSRPSITHLQALSDRQSLLVSWQLNHSSLLGDVYEIQIGRTLNHTIIYNRNISVPSIDSHEYTWTSELPLECVDHSVRIRSFYNKSVPSPWSSWKTNDGAQAMDKTKIFPFQRVLREGTSAMFCCVPPLGVNITSISINNSPQPLISISDRVKAITVEKLNIIKSFIDALSIICIIQFNLKDCVTSDMKTVTCTWDSDRKQELDNHNKKTHTLHIQNSDQPPILCEQLSCTFPAIPQLEEYNISVEVKDLLGKETESYSFNISDRVFPVVERCSVSPGVTDTTVSWFMLWNLTQVSLLCQVNTVPGVTTVMTCNSVREFCKVKLEHLQPSTRYTTRVRCSADGRLWGKWTQPVTFKTYPLVTLDVWRRITQLPDQNSRQVTLMWTPPVTGSAATVNIKGYKVQWSQGGRNQTELKSSGQTQAEVSIGPGQCDFTVQAVVSIGSTVPAQITVPQQDDQVEIPLKYNDYHSNSAAGFNLSWAQDETATCGYTVDWCILGNVVPCTLRWVKMSEGNNTLFLPGRHFKAGCRYTFSIFGCKENGHRLLEMQTGYLQELKSVPSPSLIRLVRSTSSSVMLEWSYSEDDASHPAFITGYLITVQELGSVTLSDLLNVLVSDPHRKSVTIEGLQQNQEYTFSVSALTKEGPGQAASITIRTKTNYSSLMVKILTPFFLLLGCITGEWLQSQKPEECRSCEIEILTNRPLLNYLTLRDPEALNTPPPPGPQSSLLTRPLSCDLLQAEYCPQLWGRAPLQQTTYITNESYFPTTELDLCQTQQVTLSDVK